MVTKINAIPLLDAADCLGIAAEILTNLIRNDILNLTIIRMDGQIMLDKGEIEIMSKAIGLRDKLWRKVAKFEGETIGSNEATSEFGITPPTLYRCIKNGYIRAGEGSNGGRGKKRQLNKADVAYVAELMKHLKRGRGHRLFTPETIPPHIDQYPPKTKSRHK